MTLWRITVPILTVLTVLVVCAQPVAFASEVLYPVPGDIDVAYHIFDFAAFPSGTSTPFSETIVGSPHGPMTITYAVDDQGASDFVVAPMPVSGKGLVSDPSLSPGTLLITLSRPVFGIGVSFDTFGSGVIHMEFFSAGALLWSQTFMEDAGFLAGVVPLSLQPNSFDAVAVHAGADVFNPAFFGISEVFAEENVPEPGTVAFFVGGLVGLVFRAIRQSRTRERAAGAGPCGPGAAKAR